MPKAARSFINELCQASAVGRLPEHPDLRYNAKYSQSEAGFTCEACLTSTGAVPLLVQSHSGYGFHTKAAAEEEACRKLLITADADLAGMSDGAKTVEKVHRALIRTIACAASDPRLEDQTALLTIVAKQCGRIAQEIHRDAQAQSALKTSISEYVATLEINVE